VLASPESPMTFVVYDLTRAFPRISSELGYVLWDSAIPHKPEGYSLSQVEEIVRRENFGILPNDTGISPGKYGEEQPVVGA